MAASSLIAAGPPVRNKAVAWLWLFAAVPVLGLAVEHRFAAPWALALTIGVAVVAWLFASERYGFTAAAFVLYLGLADGYLKLSTGSGYVTLARDILMYAICVGILARAFIRRDPLHIPPYGGLVIAFVLLVLVQVFNPGTGGLERGVESLRPHIEFVPLFFLGYLLVRTRSRLRGLLLLLLAIGAANGIVSYVQFTLTPGQLSAWGPGYAERIQGTGPVSERVFYDSSGDRRVRPFGLAGDSGQGGFLGLLALPAAVALISVARNRWRWIALALGFAVALAIVTSQGRSVMIGAFVAVIVYTVLTVRPGRLVPTLAVIAVLAMGVLGAISLSADHAGAGAFDRVKQIAPSRLLTSAREQRGSSIVLAPTYLAEYPFGAGLGIVGPAAGAIGTDRLVTLDGETEFNFLILELGVAGTFAFLVLLAALIRRALRRVRSVGDPELRAFLAALAAPLLGMVVMFFSSAITAGSPGGPYFWAIAGVLAYWLRSANVHRGFVTSPASVI
jgi:hypothetical protein